MKFCEAHWDRLREAIKARGLDGLVAKDGYEAAAKTKAELEGGPSKSSFDPLLGAHNAILSNTLRVAGLVILGADEKGEHYCPICYLTQNCSCGLGAECHFFGWIERAADDARENAISLGLVGST